MITFSFWQRWLLAVGLIITVFGIAMALLSGTPLFDSLNRQVDPAFWCVNAVDHVAKRFQQWIYGTWGATIAGWGIFATYIAHYPFKKKERWAWHCIVFGLVVWFMLDTSLSYFYQVYFNVALNTGLFVLAMLPMVFTRKDFQPTSSK
ncbi:MAG: hypothetical protein ACUVST_07535 [Anaerolineae bacterium]